jgi:hypothetical protein
MLGQEVPQPKLWKALLVAAIFVFPFSYALHTLFFHFIPSGIWFGVTAVLWFVFGYNSNQRMQRDYATNGFRPSDEVRFKR